MTYLSEIKIFFSTIIDWLLLLLIFTLFFFSFNVGTVELFGRLVTLPIPASPSFSAELFTMMVRDIVPVGVPLVVTGPLIAFVAQLKIAFFLALLFTAPVFFYRLMTYLSPALYAHERRLIYLLIVPASLLFFGGVVFAYLTIVPVTFSVLYGFTAPIGVTALLGVGEFVSFVLALLIIAGLSFMLPVVMVSLTALGAVSGKFWSVQTGKALTLVLILSAIMTPDGSGVSMVLLAAPVSVLYGVGAIVSAQMASGQKRNEHEVQTHAH